MQTDTTTPNIVGLTMLAQQLPTTHNKRTQHVTSNDVGSCWPTMLRPYGQVMLRSPIPLITLEPLLSGHSPNSLPSVHGRGSLCCASRDFKMPRRRRQRKKERQKSSVRLKHTFFVHFFSFTARLRRENA